MEILGACKTMPPAGLGGSCRNTRVANQPLSKFQQRRSILADPAVVSYRRPALQPFGTDSGKTF